MAAAARDHYSLDRSLTDEARLAFASVNPMLELEESFFAIGVHVIGDR